MFLVNNYKQALHILDTKPLVIKMLASLGATDANIVKTLSEDTTVHLPLLLSFPPPLTIPDTSLHTND